MKFDFAHIFIVVLCIIFSPHLFAQTDTIVEIDTVYLPPDTIKKVRTIIVYEDDNSKPSTKKKRNQIAHMYGIHMGLTAIQQTPFLGALQYSYVRNTLCISGLAQYQSKYNNTISYNYTYTTYTNRIDTIRTLVDEFIQIIGDDTITHPVYTYTYIHKKDSIEQDKVRIATNTYRHIQIPIVIGYCKSTRKYLYAIGAGAQFRFILPSSSNTYVLQSDFVPEINHIQKFNIDVVSYIQTKQKISKHMWFCQSISASYPLRYDFTEQKKSVLRSQGNIMIGLEYRL